MKKMKIKPNSENNSYYQFNPAQPNEIPTFVQYSNSTKRPTTVFYSFLYIFDLES